MSTHTTSQHTIINTYHIYPYYVIGDLHGLIGLQLNCDNISSLSSTAFHFNSIIFQIQQNILPTFLEHSSDILGIFFEHSSDILHLFAWNILRIFSTCFFISHLFFFFLHLFLYFFSTCFVFPLVSFFEYSTNILEQFLILFPIKPQGTEPTL
jgi:hypothetical protein